MATVKVINPKTSEAVTIETQATTWGELRSQLMDHSELGEINYEDARVFLKDSQSKKTLGLSSDSLSDEPSYKLFVSPIKMKAGAVRYSATVIRDLKVKLERLLEDVIDDMDRPAVADTSNIVTDEDLEDFEDMQ